MSNYRENKLIKKCLLNVGKGTFLLGLTVCICIHLNKQIDLANVEAAIYPMPREEIILADEQDNISFDEETLFAMPVSGTITSNFGERWGKNHNGIDIGALEGDEILAAEDGVVTYSGWVDGYGNYLILDHENGFQTCYAHCSSLISMAGDRVVKGQKIAYVGSTGRSTGPHLHFEIKFNGVFQDPSNYILY